jgi:putative DNA primase/helicase
VTRPLVQNVAMSLKAATHLDDQAEPPTWLGDGPAPLPPGIVLPTRNSLVHLPSGQAVPPTPRFFCPYALDFDFDPAAPEPAKWLRFLGSLWPDDHESVATLGEWCGYVLTTDTSHQRALFLIGPPRSGKGTIARVLRRLVGPENVAGPTLAGLATNFGLEPLIGRPLAIVADARLSARTDRGVITERLLSISGEDTLTIDRKNKQAWTGKLATRLMLMSNETPWLNDSSRALAGRFLTLHVKESFEGREDHGLERRLVAELPGILLWAVEGWRRLQARGHFLQPASGRALAEEMRELSSRAGTFLAEACEVGEGHQELILDVFNAWEHWCRGHNEATVGSTRTLSKELRTVVPRLTTDATTRAPGKSSATQDGRTKRLYGGLRLNAEWSGIVEGL